MSPTMPWSWTHHRERSPTLYAERDDESRVDLGQFSTFDEARVEIERLEAADKWLEGHDAVLEFPSGPRYMYTDGWELLAPS